jgi:hypothetical protein
MISAVFRNNTLSAVHPTFTMVREGTAQNFAFRKGGTHPEARSSHRYAYVLSLVLS